jgi:hypothetical protein
MPAARAAGAASTHAESDHIVERPAVEARQHLFHPRLPRQPAIGRTIAVASIIRPNAPRNDARRRRAR